MSDMQPKKEGKDIMFGVDLTPPGSQDLTVVAVAGYAKKDPEDPSVSYFDTGDGLRLIFRDNGKYAGYSIDNADVVEVVHGRWEPIKRKNIWGDETDVLECSECKKYTVAGKGITRYSAYCPNCGARMDGE